MSAPVQADAITVDAAVLDVAMRHGRNVVRHLPDSCVVWIGDGLDRGVTVDRVGRNYRVTRLAAGRVPVVGSDVVTDAARVADVVDAIMSGGAS